MTRTERERITALRANAVRARQAWRRHRQGCRLCTQLAKNRSQYCTPGWDIRMQLHTAERALAEATRPPVPQSQALF